MFSRCKFLVVFEFLLLNESKMEAIVFGPFLAKEIFYFILFHFYSSLKFDQSMNTVSQVYFI